MRNIGQRLFGILCLVSAGVMVFLSIAAFIDGAITPAISILYSSFLAGFCGVINYNMSEEKK